MRPSRVVLASVLLAAIGSACDRSSATVLHSRLTSLDPLQEAFNADSGKVRAIFLASPT